MNVGSIPVTTIDHSGKPLSFFLEDKREWKGKPDGLRTWAAALIDTPEFKAMVKGGGSNEGEFRLQVLRPADSEFKTVSSMTSGSLVVPGYDYGSPTPLPRRELVVRDLFMPGRTTSNVVPFQMEMSKTSAAAGVLETYTKPESDYVYAINTTRVGLIATVIKMSRQLFDDSEAFKTALYGDLTYDLQYVEDNAFLNGDGATGYVDGIVKHSTPFAAPAGVATDRPTRIDVILQAIAQCNQAGVKADGVILNATDFDAMQGLKDTAGRYILGDPSDDGAPMLWKRPVAATLAMAPGTFLVGAFKTVQIYDRQAVEIVLAKSNEADFQSNLVAIRAEERAALAVKRPESLIYGTF